MEHRLSNIYATIPPIYNHRKQLEDKCMQIVSRKRCALQKSYKAGNKIQFNLAFQSLKQLKAFHVTNLPNLKFLMDRAWMAIVVLCQKTLFHAYMQRELHSIFSQASFLEAISPSFPENLASAKQRLRPKPQKFELLLSICCK